MVDDAGSRLRLDLFEVIPEINPNFLDLQHLLSYTINLLGVSYLPLREHVLLLPGVFVQKGCARYFGSVEGQG